MSPTKIITPPPRVASDDVRKGLQVIAGAGLVASWKEQTNDAGDKRRWIVKLTTGETVALGPAQVWAFLFGMTVALGRTDGVIV